MRTGITICQASKSDAEAIWNLLEPVIRVGETYALPRDMKRVDALAYWFAPHHEVFIAKINTTIVGTYFLCPNQQGGGSHVANCGYITASSAQGQGVASAMCQHSIEYATKFSFKAMQFNFVISSNTRAIRLWERFEFKIIGQLSSAFLHPTLGYVDAFIMFRSL